MKREPWLPADLDTDKGGLQRRVARGLTWTLIDTWGTQLLGLVVFVILARLLSAVDFGLVALAAVFVVLAQLVVDQGLGDALIQRRSVTRSQIDTAFWVAVLTGALLTVAGFLLAGPIATVLGEPRLEQILQVLSLTFVLAALSSIQLALLRREMAFRSLTVRKLVSVGGSGAIGIAMAYMGFGAWALVGQQLANAALSVVMLWTVSPWRPGLQVSRSDFRELLGFGMHIVGGDILNFLSRNMDNLLIGVFLGPAPLGFYAVAYRVLDTSQSLLVNAARKMAFPVFARLQHDPERIKRGYTRVTRALSMLILPAYIGLSLVAQEAIVVIFGQRWADSGPVAAVLYLIGPVLTIQLFSGALLNAVGHPEVTFRIRLVTTIVNVAGFLIAVVLFRDILAVAAAFVIRAYLLLPLIVWWMRVYAGIPIVDYFRQLRGVVLATAAMAVAVVAVKLVLAGQASDALLLAAEIVVGAAVYGAALWWLERGLIHDVVGILGMAVPGGDRVARRLGVDIPPARGRRAATSPATNPVAEVSALDRSLLRDGIDDV